MGIEETSWSAIDVLNIVDGAELVTIVREVYLCVWHGSGVVEIYDLRKSSIEGDYAWLPMFSSLCLLTAHEAIDTYFASLDDEIANEDLTSPLLGVIVKTESDEPQEIS